MLSLELIDSHCHLDFPGLKERLPDVLAEMAKNKVQQALCAGVRLEDFPAMLHLVEQDARLWAAVGVHPENTDCQEPDVQTLVQLSQHPKVLAIGETGLDYYWHKDKPAWQRERFRIHIQAARQAGKPLIVHTREAAHDTLSVMQEENAAQVGGVMHCFTETKEVAKAALDQNFYISLSGIVTFKAATQVKELARYVPLDRLLIETDSPYLSPVPYRGKPNQPAYVVYVAQEIAWLRGISTEALAQATCDNFYRLFPSAQPF